MRALWNGEVHAKARDWLKFVGKDQILAACWLTRCVGGNFWCVEQNFGAPLVTPEAVEEVGAYVIFMIPLVQKLPSRARRPTTNERHISQRLLW